MSNKLQSSDHNFGSRKMAQGKFLEVVMIELHLVVVSHSRVTSRAATFFSMRRSKLTILQNMNILFGGCKLQVACCMLHVAICGLQFASCRLSITFLFFGNSIIFKKRWNIQHAASVGQRKKSESMNPWPSVHRSDALTTELLGDFFHKGLFTRQHKKRIVSFVKKLLVSNKRWDKKTWNWTRLSVWEFAEPFPCVVTDALHPQLRMDILGGKCALIIKGPLQYLLRPLLGKNEFAVTQHMYAFIGPNLDNIHWGQIWLSLWRHRTTPNVTWSETEKCVLMKDFPFHP